MVIRFSLRSVYHPVLTFLMTISRTAFAYSTWGFGWTLSFDTFIREKCKKAMYTLHRIRSFRSHFSRKCLLQIVQSLVISQLDYCSSLLYGLPNITLDNLQRVQNFAAKLNKSTFDRSTDCLRQLHWLPVKSIVS